MADSDSGDDVDRESDVPVPQDLDADNEGR